MLGTESQSTPVILLLSKMCIMFCLPVLDKNDKNKFFPKHLEGLQKYTTNVSFHLHACIIWYDNDRVDIESWLIRITRSIVMPVKF